VIGALPLGVASESIAESDMAEKVLAVERLATLAVGFDHLSMTW